MPGSIITEAVEQVCRVLWEKENSFVLVPQGPSAKGQSRPRPSSSWACPVHCGAPALLRKSLERLGGGQSYPQGLTEWRKLRPRGERSGQYREAPPRRLWAPVPPMDRKGGFRANWSTKFQGPGWGRLTPGSPSGPRYLCRRPRLSDLANKNTRFLITFEFRINNE